MTAPPPSSFPVTWRRFLGEWLRDLADPATYKMGLYLLLSVPLGSLYLLGLLVGFSTGASLLVLAIGVPILVATVLSAIAFAKLERSLGRTLLDVHLPHDSTVEQLRRRGWWRWLGNMLAELNTWKALLFLTLKLPLGLLSSLILLGLGVISLSLLFAPLLPQMGYPEAVSVAGNRQLSRVGWMMLPIAGFGGLMVTASVTQGLGKVHRWLVTTLLYESEDTRRTRRQVEALSRSASIVAYAGTLADTIGPLLEEAIAATGATGCVFSAFPPSPQGGPELCAHPGVPETWARRLVAEYLQAPHRYAEVQRGNVCQRVVHPGPQSAGATLYSLPVIYRGEWLGRLDFLFPGEPPKQSDAFLGAIADQAAVAVQNSRLFAQVQEQVSKEERQRLARELHDSVSQALYGITLGLETALTWLERDPAKARKPIEYAFQLSKGGTAEMRALLFALRPESLEQEGLVAALGKQATVLSARYHLNVQTELCAEPDAPLAVKEAFYRIAQEALHNVVKHANANEVVLSMRAQENTLYLEIADDGIGFDTNQAFPGHLGLQSMRERVSSIQGRLELASQPGKGTRLRVSAPLREPQNTVPQEALA